jgi:hypothetical protein
MYTWWHDFKEGAGYSTSGRNKRVSARSAAKRSPGLLDGTAITSYGDQKEGQIGWKIGCYCIPPAINKFIARIYTLRSRVR